MKAWQALSFHCFPWNLKHGTYQWHQSLPWFKDNFCPSRHFYLVKNKILWKTFSQIEWIHCSVQKEMFTPTKPMKFTTDLSEAIVLPHHSCLAIALQNSIFLTAVPTVAATVKHEQPFSLGREHLSLLKHYTSCIFNSVLVKIFLIFPSPIKS